MSTIKERVQAGAELLDKVLPDWWNGKETPTIDLKILAMVSTRMCVLGQCFGDYEDGCKKLGIFAWSIGKDTAGAFGFFGGDYASTSLTAPWRTEIRRRRRNAKQS